MHGRPWGTGGALAGKIVRYVEARDASRLGHGDWRPADGDICMPSALRGDHFYEYRAFRDVHGTGVLIEVGTFGAYVFGEPVAARLQLTLTLD